MSLDFGNNYSRRRQFFNRTEVDNYAQHSLKKGDGPQPKTRSDGKTIQVAQKKMASAAPGWPETVGNLFRSSHRQKDFE